jgi:hypothetical protein
MSILWFLLCNSLLMVCIVYYQKTRKNKDTGPSYTPLQRFESDDTDTVPWLIVNDKDEHVVVFDASEAV